MVLANPFKYSVGTRVRDNIFKRMLQPGCGDRILDAGCGMGYFTDMLNNGAYCIGVDLDRDCIHHCQQYMKGAYLSCDLHELPFPDNYFDKVLCTEVLEHIKDNGKVLDELHRVIKPGGIMVASVPCSEGVFGARFKNIGHSHVDSNSYEYHHHKGYNWHELAKLLGAHGFKVDDLDYTLVFGTEVFMGLTKAVVHRLQHKEIDSQTNALGISNGNSKLWRLYKGLFPLILLGARIEQPLAGVIKGHMLIMKGVARK